MKSRRPVNSNVTSAQSGLNLQWRMMIMKSLRLVMLLLIIAVTTIAVGINSSLVNAQRDLSVEDIYGRWGDPNVVELDGRQFSLNVFMVKGPDQKWMEMLYIYDITDPSGGIPGRSFGLNARGQITFRMSESPSARRYTLELHPIPGDLEVSLMSRGGSNATNAAGKSLSIRTLLDLRNKRVARFGESARFPPGTYKREDLNSTETMTTPTATVNWSGTYVSTASTMTVVGTARSLSATEQWKTGGRNGTNTWVNCQVKGNTAKCNWTGTYEGDPDKTAERHGTLEVTLSGNTITGTYYEDEPTFHWNVGAYPSAIHKGATWPINVQRKQ
jgi:hypothetical protein